MLYPEDLKIIRYKKEPHQSAALFCIHWNGLMLELPFYLND